MTYTLYVCPECGGQTGPTRCVRCADPPKSVRTEVVPRSVADELVDRVEAFIAATVPSVSDEWTRLGEALAKYREAINAT